MYYVFYPDGTVKEFMEGLTTIGMPMYTIAYFSESAKPFTIKVAGRWIECTDIPDWVKVYILLME